MTKLIVAFRNFAKALIRSTITERKFGDRTEAFLWIYSFPSGVWQCRVTFVVNDFSEESLPSICTVHFSLLS